MIEEEGGRFGGGVFGSRAMGSLNHLRDVSLIFVPSKVGRSHCPEEWTDYEDLQKGIELIYCTILELGEIAV